VLAGAALVVAAATAALPVAGVALAPLPGSATHVAALGCTRADVCTTAVGAGVVESRAAGAVTFTDGEFYPIAPATALGNAATAARPAFACGPCMD
jgi:hypothetical protein